MGLFGRRDSPEQRFWRWFQAQEDRLFDFEADQERVFEELRTELKRVHPDLTFEFGPKRDERRDFTVSADGIKAAFPAVHALVDAAPVLPRWRILRFRQRGGADLELRFGGHRLCGGDVYVWPEPDGDKVGLTLFLPDYKPTPEKVYEHMGYLLLDNVLGEFDVEMRISFIEFAPAAQRAERAIPLPELPAYVDRTTAT